ncbi:MAG: peptide deformylase [Gemmobacter sp.]
MPVLPIMRWPDPRLGQVCAPVAGDVAGLVADLFDTMYAAPGRGLAAPQVGALVRLFVMDTGWRSGVPAPMACLNPEILWQSDTRAEGAEGCLSIPGPTTMIERATQIRLGWTDLDGMRHEALLDGFAAVCAQHEHDHLDGILTLDRLSPQARAEAILQVSP